MNPKDELHKIQEYETKLAAANNEISRLQSHIDSIPEEDVPSGNTMLEHSESLIIHNGNSHHKSSMTLSDILYTSEHGDTIYREPLTDTLRPREIQCRTENWSDSWKNALNSLTDASVSMQGYLCKMTASKWNSRGTLDKIQRRWFVLRANYLTYFKTNLHTQPKSDKCVNVLNYKVNPVIHSKSKFAFELISAPKTNPHKKSSSNPNSPSPSSQDQCLERTKFI